MRGSPPRGSTRRRPIDVADLVRRHDITHVMNAVDPRFVMPIFNGALAGGADYLDMAMSLSQRHPERAVRTDRRQARRRAVRRGGPVGGRRAGSLWSGSASSRAFPTCSPGTPPTISSPISTSWARATGRTSTVDGYEFAPSFSIWTTIEECLNPPVIWEADRGWFTTEPFSEPEVFDFPDGIGPVECVNVEHEEVLLMPRWVKCKRATFKYGLGAEFIDVLKTLHKLGLDRTEKVTASTACEVSPRDVVAACLPDPGHARGRRCAARPAPACG